MLMRLTFSAVDFRLGCGDACDWFLENRVANATKPAVGRIHAGASEYFSRRAAAIGTSRQAPSDRPFTYNAH